MTKNDNDLKNYIDEVLSSDYKKLVTVKDSDKSKVYIYEQTSGNNKLVLRYSVNRNDDVFRELRTIRNKNIVKIYEVCSDEKYIITLEEYINGKNLYDIIEKGNLNKKSAYKYAMQLCDALDVIHNAGIIHRDIKPENVIITKNDNAVLIDFSIARKISAKSNSDTDNLGTIGYAAPEQYGISQSGIETDIYSLGVLLNIMLVGKHPAVSLPKGAVKRIIKKSTSTQIAERYKNVKKIKKELKFLSLFDYVKENV